MRILVIEDDLAMAETLVTIFERQGFQVDAVDTAEEGLIRTSATRYALLLLDLLLPGMRGDELLHRLRARGSDIPTLVLSSLEAPETKVRCLAAGADDYLVKPFDRRELMARIRAILRRARGADGRLIQVGELAIDRAARIITFRGKSVRLTAREFDVLELLALRRGTVLTKAMFQNHLYAGRDVPHGKGIDVFICKLRRKLAAATGGEHYIETVWGMGYRLSPPPEADDAMDGTPSLHAVPS